MRTRLNLETGPMPLVDCPLCDHPIPFDPAEAALDCPDCGVRVAFAPDPQAALAVAA
jgi:DNA-directed RNA polymerase subunit RPC12/RpoP